MTGCVDVDHLSVRYGEVVALSGVTVSVEPGRVTGLIIS